jgi:hypothetical protein
VITTNKEGRKMSKKIPNATREQMIDHIVASAPILSKLTFQQTFGPVVFPPSDKSRTMSKTMEVVCQHIRQHLESDFHNLDILYDDLDGNDELVDYKVHESLRAMLGYCEQMAILKSSVAYRPNHVGKGHQGCCSF